MYVKVICDNKAKRGLVPGRGFSCLVDGKVLFDTGPDADTLRSNMEKLMVPVSDIKAVVISHDHWDHTGGLWEIIRMNKGIKVYACKSFSDEFKKSVKGSGGKLCFNNGITEVSDNVFAVGPFHCEYNGDKVEEQVLAVSGQKGVSVITGCAHPGAYQLAAEIKKNMRKRKLYMMFGGFHLDGEDREGILDLADSLKKAGVEKIGPSHCSGEKARRVLRGKYHENFIPVKAGHIIQL